METADKKCPDCGRPMKAIKILDNARYGVRPAESVEVRPGTTEMGPRPGGCHVRSGDELLR
jgi:hypothetical protein